MPADVYDSLAASISRSSRPRSQCSTKRVHPMPTIATRSLIPWLAISQQPPFPEVVRDAVGGEQPAERHLHAHADRHFAFVDVGELHRQPSAAVEIDDGEHDRRTR